MARRNKKKNQGTNLKIKKKAAPKKAAPKKVAAKKASPKKAAVKKATPKKINPKKTAAKKNTQKKITPKKNNTNKPKKQGGNKKKGNDKPKLKIRKKAAKKQIKKKIIKKGEDGRLNKKDIKQISKTAYKRVGDKKLTKMINRYGKNNDLKISKKIDKLIPKFNKKKYNPKKRGDASDTPIYDLSDVALPGEASQGGSYVQTGAPPYSGPPSLEEELEVLEEPEEEELIDYDDPRYRQYVLGIRTKRGNRNRQGTRGSFGRGGTRISGMKVSGINI